MTVRWRKESRGCYVPAVDHRFSVQRIGSGEIGDWGLATPWGWYGYPTAREAKADFELASEEFDRTGAWPPLHGTSISGWERRLADVPPGVSITTPCIIAPDGVMIRASSGGPLVAVDRTPSRLADVSGWWVGATCRARNGMTWKVWVSAERPVVMVPYGVGALERSRESALRCGIDLTEPPRDELGRTVI